MRGGHAVYTAALTALGVLYAPAAMTRRLAHGVPLNLRARLGLGLAPGAATHGWIHAVSVGETIAAAALVDGLRKAHPELPLVVTTVTDTGARVVRERFAGAAEHRFFPLDLPGASRRVIEAINPAFLIVMETELWPNTLRLLAERKTPVMIANGRVSDRSFRRYRLVRGFMRQVLADVRVFAMQSAEDARRIIALGADPERVFVTGNVKHEPLAAGEGGPERWRRLFGIEAGRRVWVAGSTHRGEEEAALDAHALVLGEHPDLVLVLAPRHPERVPDVARLVASRGRQAVRRSELPRPHPARAVILLDTVGELADIYSIADVVFVGGSLAPMGGHNVLEPALCRKPVLFGPHTHNFREAAALLLRSGGGLIVRDAAELAAELRRLLDDAGLRARVGEAAYQAATARNGAVPATLDLLLRLVYPAAVP